MTLLSTALACSSRSEEILLASTTSTEDSGLFEHLLPAFHAAHPAFRVRVVAVGSGEALSLGARGDADVVLAHSPAAERAFVAAGHAESRRAVMYNDFVIVGPADGPGSDCRGSQAAQALACIAASGATFISRGDHSGTHARELELWSAAGIEPRGRWYADAGQGMGAVLMMAGEKRAYTVSDRGTYLYLRARLDLEVVVEGDPALRNQYSVIVVRGAANPEGARAFAEWITGPEAQGRIAEYGVARFGRPLFIPNAAGQTRDAA